jgi:hypothetical protein
VRLARLEKEHSWKSLPGARMRKGSVVGECSGSMRNAAQCTLMRSGSQKISGMAMLSSQDPM